MIVSGIIAAFALLITYWWASSGAWSALLHLICVVIAGALAFALWEPVAYMLLPRGISGYAMGGTLLGLFLVFLLVARLGMDRLVPANLQPPKAVDVLGGVVFGAASGVLTMGMIVIGAGFVQSTAEIGDVSGYVRRSDEPKAPAIGNDNAPVLHLARATSSFFGFLSWGSFTPWLGGGTLRTHQPDLVQSAMSLYRDSFNNGMGRVALIPDSVTGITLYDPGSVVLTAGEGGRAEPALAVKFKVDQAAFDSGGQQFLLSASQARLVGAARGGAAASVHPVAWIQATERGRALFFFSSNTTYATSQPPGAGEAEFVLFFPKNGLDQQEAKFFELKGVRFPLGRPNTGAEAFSSLMKASSKDVLQDSNASLLSAPMIESPEARWSLPVTLNSNEKGRLVLDDSNYIIGGDEKFPRNAGASVNSDLRIQGFKPTEGARLVKINATCLPGGARLFPDLNDWIREAGAEAQDARVAVVDDKGDKYFVLGYAEDDGTYLSVKSGAGSPMRLRDIPIQTLGADKKLWLYFGVPDRAKLKYLVLDTPKGLRVVNTLDFVAKQAGAE